MVKLRKNQGSPQYQQLKHCSFRLFSRESDSRRAARSHSCHWKKQRNKTEITARGLEQIQNYISQKRDHVKFKKCSRPQCCGLGLSFLQLMGNAGFLGKVSLTCSPNGLATDFWCRCFLQQATFGFLALSSDKKKVEGQFE